MKKLTQYLKYHRYKIRLLYWIMVALVFIFIVLPVFFFFYLFNETQVKQMIIDQFDNNNYHVEVVGHVSPKLWHGLSLDFQDVEIQTKDYNSLFKINSVNCQLSWLDLVFAKYKISRIAIDGVKINEDALLNNANLGNLFSLSNQHYDIFNRLSTINIYSIKTYNGHKYNISDGAIQIKLLGVKADFELWFKLLKQNAYVLIKGTNNGISNNMVAFKNFNVKVYAGKNFQLKFTSNASYELDKQRLLLSNINGNATYNNYNSKIAATWVALATSGLLVTNLQLDTNYGQELTNFNIKMLIDDASITNYAQLFIHNIQTKYTAKFADNLVEINSVMNNVNYNESVDAIVSDDCNGNFNLQGHSFGNNKFTGNYAGSCKYLQPQNLLDLNFIGKLNQAVYSLKLQLFNQSVPYIAISGSIDKLDLSRLKVTKDKILPLFYDNSLLPFSWLSLINADGNLSINHFMLDRISLNNLTTEFSINNGTLNVNNLRADVYNGTLLGNGKVQKVNGNMYNIQSNQTVSNVNLQYMFSDLFDVQAISGIANFTANISADNLTSYSDIYRNLNGKILVRATNGAFQGIDLNLFRAPDAMNLATVKSTAFESLEALFNFHDGVSKNGNIEFSSKYVIAKGVGIVDFDRSKIGYNLSIKSALPDNNEKISSVLIPVVVVGDLFNPKVTIKNIHLYTMDIVNMNNKNVFSNKKIMHKYANPHSKLK